MPADLLLLHGFTQTGASWGGVVRALEGRYRALAPDLGAGPWEAELDRLEALAPAPCALAGYSMGGRLALALALRRRERVRALVLVSASPGLADAGERAARRAADEALAERIEALGADAFAREWAAQPLFAGQPAEIAALAHADRLRRPAAEHAAQLRGLGTGVMPPLWDRLGELAMAEEMVERLPHGEVVVAAGAGHAVALEAPQAVAEAIGRTHPPVPWIVGARAPRE
jgi:pimeloyl-ACP methyl ester carboxylesterase